MNDLTALKQYYASLGMNHAEVERVVNLCRMRTPELIQQKVESLQAFLQIDNPTMVHLIRRFPRLLNFDLISEESSKVKNRIREYQDLLQADAKTVVKMITAFPALLSFDSTSDNAKAVRSKIKDYQTTLHADLASVQKMIISYPVLLGLDTKTTIKNKLADLQATLHADAATVTKMVMDFPQLLGYEITGDSPTAVKHKLRHLKDVFRVDEQTLTGMVSKAPSLLGMDAISHGPKSLRTKVDKLRSVLTPEQLRECMVKTPAVLTVPAQAFKIRYMLAENLGIMSRFLKIGYMVNQNKVWARASYLNRHPVLNLKSVYINEKDFHHRFGRSSAELMQQYPLDQTAVFKIEQNYLLKTGNNLTLDQQERTALGLEK